MRFALLLAAALSLSACDAAASETAPAPFADASAQVSFTCEGGTVTPLPNGSVLFEGTLSVSTQTTGNPEGVRTIERWVLTGPPARDVSTTMGGTPDGFTCQGEGTARRGADGLEVRVRSGDVRVGENTVALKRGTFTEDSADAFTCSGTATPRPDGSVLFEGTLSVSTTMSGNPEGIRTIERWALTGPPARDVSTTMGGTPEGFTCEGSGDATRERGRIVVEIEAGRISIAGDEIALEDGTFTERRGRR
jgi:hypothetical protein